MTWTLKMTTTWVLETSVTVNNTHQDYVHPDDHAAQPIYVNLIC